jgi:hypothetical protein
MSGWPGVSELQQIFRIALGAALGKKTERYIASSLSTCRCLFLPCILETIPPENHAFADLSRKVK